MSSQATVIKQVLMGDLSVLGSVQQPKGKLSIFVSSTFTDTHAERNILIQDILPRLQARARPHGVEVMFSDMRFGVKDENGKEHDTWEMCAREIRRCHEESDGAFFLSLQGDKYGYQALPKHLSKAIVDAKLANVAVTQADKDLLLEWYVLDENCLPEALYALKTLSDDKAEQDTYWRVVLPALLNVLAGTPIVRIAGQVGDLLVKQSVTEWETRYALDLPGGRSLHFRRSFADIMARHQGLCDVLNKPEEKQKLDELLAHLQSHPHCATFAMGSISLQSYVDKVSAYDDYLANWQSAAHDVLDQELTNVLARSEAWDRDGLDCSVSGKMLEELLHHARFRAERCSHFYGRRDLLQKALVKAKEKHEVSSEPYTAITMCVVGVSGSGKTSLMSMLATELRASENQNIPVIIRYCGTSNMSCDGFSLIRSLIWQIRFLYCLQQDDNAWPAFARYGDAVQALHGLLEQYPVILLLDSLDQLSNQNEEYSRISLLMGCKPHKDSVIIVSTLPDDRDAQGNVKLFQADALLEQQRINRISVPLLDIRNEASIRGIVGEILFKNGRAICDAQWQLMWQSIRVEPTILYLTFACAVAKRWKSNNDTVSLAASVKGIIAAMFDRLQTVYGSVLIEHVIGFLTISNSGVSNLELLDLLSLPDCKEGTLMPLLSLDDAVLNEVFQYSELETVRRLPVHVWLRIRQELSAFLVEKSNGSLRWYHRQLVETAVERYSSHRRLYFHNIMGQYFANLVPGDVRGLRHILAQDIILSASPKAASAVWHRDSVVNVRRCMEALFHLVRAEMYDEAVSEVCEVSHVCAYLRAGQGYELLEQVEVLSNVRDISDYFRWLRSSMSALSVDPLNRVISTALEQPMSSIVRHAVEQLTIPNENSVFTHKRLGGWDSFGNLLMTLRGHLQPILSVFVGLDGRTLVSGSVDKTLKIWDLQSGRCLRTLLGQGVVSTVCISADGRRIVSGSRDMCVQIWDAQLGCCLHSLKSHIGGVNSVCVSSDSSKVLSGSDDCTVKLWDMLSGECIRTFQGHSAAVKCVCITSDCRRIVSCSTNYQLKDYVVKVWNSESGQCIKDIRQFHSIEAICLSPDNLIVSAQGKTIKVSSLSGECSKTVDCTNGAGFASVCLAPEAKSMIISCTTHSFLTIFDIQSRSGDCLRTFGKQDHVAHSISITPDGGKVVSACDAAMNIWNMDFNQQDPVRIGHSGLLADLSFSPDGRMIVSAGYDDQVLVWDATTGELLDSWKLSHVQSICVSPDGKHIVTGLNMKICFWDLESNDKVTLDHLATTTFVEYTPDGMHVVSANDTAVFVWVAQSKVLYRTLLLDEEGRIVTIHLSPDSEYVAALAKDGVYKKWNIHHDEEIEHFRISQFACNERRCCFSPDGRKIVCADTHKMAAVFDIESGQKLLDFVGHRYHINSCCISQNGKTLVTGSYDETVRVWDMNTGHCLTCFHLLEQVKYVSISQDGTKIAAGCINGDIRLFQYC